MSKATAVSDLERSEHENGTKKVTTYGTDGTNLIIPYEIKNGTTH